MKLEKLLIKIHNMISIVYCTREHNQHHIDHLKKACGHPKVEVIEYINNGEGLTKFYKIARILDLKNYPIFHRFYLISFFHTNIH